MGVTRNHDVYPFANLHQCNMSWAQERSTLLSSTPRQPCLCIDSQHRITLLNLDESACLSFYWSHAASSIA